MRKSFGIPISLVVRSIREQEKRQQREEAFESVNKYEDYIKKITSLHKECCKILDWSILARTEKPIKPIYVNVNAKLALKRFKEFKPNFLEKIFPLLEKRKKKILYNKIYEKRIKDKEIYKKKYLEFESKYKEWKELIEIANNVIIGNKKVYKKIIDKFTSFSKIDFLCESLEIKIDDIDYFDVYVKVYDEQIIPKKIYKLTQTGRLSIKEISVSKLNELYNEYVCSCIFRIVREIFAVLPIKIVYLHILKDILNTIIGKLEEKVIISVVFEREKLKDINFDLIYPPDSIKNFISNVNYKMKYGFKEVEKVKRIN